MALPLDAVAQYPILTGLGNESPGFRTERPAVLEDIRQSRPHIQWYKECLAKHEASLRDGASLVGDRLEGTAALVAYYWMRRYASHIWMSNAMWYSWAFDVLRGRTQVGGIPHGEEGRGGRKLVL